MRNRFLQMASATILISSTAVIAFGQNGSVDGCEFSAAKIDTVKHAYLSTRSGDTKLTIVGTNGRNETSSNINKKRLELALRSLVKLGVDEKRISVSESDAVSALPAVSFYIDGKLIAEITTSTDKLFCTDCCENDDIREASPEPLDFYGNIPWNEERGRLDNFAIYLSRDPDTVGHISYHVGEKDDLKTVRRRMEKGLEYLVKRWKINRQRLILDYNGRSEETRVMLFFDHLPKK